MYCFMGFIVMSWHIASLKDLALCVVCVQNRTIDSAPAGGIAYRSQALCDIVGRCMTGAAEGSLFHSVKSLVGDTTGRYTAIR